ARFWVAPGGDGGREWWRGGARTTGRTTRRPRTASVTTSPRPMRLALYAMAPYTSRRVRATPPIPRASEEHLDPVREQDPRRHARPPLRLPGRPRARRHRLRVPDRAAGRRARRGVAGPGHGSRALSPPHRRRRAGDP